MPASFTEPRRIVLSESKDANQHMWYLYIINRNKCLYVGITQDLLRRIRDHKSENSLVELLYKEEFSDKFQAAKRERQLKGWTRGKEVGPYFW